MPRIKGVKLATPRTTKTLSGKDVLWNGLTKKQYDWALEYMKTGNATQSALKAYPNITYETAEQVGTENLRKPRIVDFMESEMSKYISEDFILRELWKDVRTGNAQARTAALTLLAKIKAMVSERHINVDEQKKEYSNITYESFSEDSQEAKA